MAQLPPSRNDPHRLGWRTPGGWRLCVPLLILGLVLFGLSALAQAPRKAGSPPRQDEPVRPFLTQHCQGCHSGARPKGKFRLDSLTQDFNDRANRERWLAVAEQVESGAMPPRAKKPRPAEKDVRAFTA